MVRWRGWLALAAVVLVTVGIFQTGAGQALLRQAGVVAAPPGYTELTFARLQALPYRAASQAKFNVSFVIHNVTGVTHDYQWSLWVVNNGHSHYMGKGNTTVGPGRGPTVTHAVTMFCSGGHAKIVVRLASPAEYIDFWSKCLPKARRRS
jgi:hypothetical protein